MARWSIACTRRRVPISRDLSWRITRTAIRHDIMREIAGWAHRNSESTKAVRDFFRISWPVDTDMHATYRWLDITSRSRTGLLNCRCNSAPCSKTYFMRFSLSGMRHVSHFGTIQPERNWCTSKCHIYFIPNVRLHCGPTCVLDQIAQRLYLPIGSQIAKL